MQTSLHAILLLVSVPAAGLVSWRFAAMPLGVKAWTLRVMLALATLIAVAWFSTGFFKCLCGTDNNPFLQGLIPGLEAAAIVVCVSGWRIRIAAVAILYVLAVALSWHFHELLFPENKSSVVAAYTGATDELFVMCGKQSEARELWHSSFTGLHACVPRR